jgi:translation initiation factor eIF-2B subunit alpha
MEDGFDVVKAYETHLSSSSDLPMPIAAILALCDLVAGSPAETTSELMVTIRKGCEELRSNLPNPVPAQAGMDLFQRFVVMKNWDGPSAGGSSGHASGSRRQSAATSYKDEFTAHRQSLVGLAREFAANTAPKCRERITELTMPFIRDDAVSKAIFMIFFTTGS